MAPGTTHTPETRALLSAAIRSAWQAKREAEAVERPLITNPVIIHCRTCDLAHHWAVACPRCCGRLVKSLPAQEAA